MQRKRSAPPHAQEPPEGAQESERVALTVRETSLCLGLPQPTVYAYIKKGHLPAIKIGGRLLVPRAAVLALLDDAMDKWDGPDGK
ncbi:MAG: helix-turn-helix domain-containing protein [Gaiellaceae bacterium]